MTGFFSLILHAHLPFVRHPEHPEFLEEDWLYEAITEVYLPIIFAFSNLYESGARPRLAMNVSPPLCEMLSDALLQERYTRHLENLLALTQKEVERTRREAPEFQAVTRMYNESLSAALALWNDRYDRNLVRAFRDLGWDAPIDYLLPHLHAGGERRHLGLKYHRISGRDVPQDIKLPYDPAAARERAAEDAGHFVWERIKQARHLSKQFNGRMPLV